MPANETIYYGIIADGIHTHPAALRIAYRSNSNGLILVTDAISALGLEDGEHHIGQLLVKIEKGRAVIAGTNTLCGSITSMDECIRIFKRSTGRNQNQILKLIAYKNTNIAGLFPIFRLFDCTGY